MGMIKHTIKKLINISGNLPIELGLPHGNLPIELGLPMLWNWEFTY